MFLRQLRFLADSACAGVRRVSVDSSSRKVVYVRCVDGPHMLSIELPYEEKQPVPLKRSFIFNSKKNAPCADLCQKIEKKLSVALLKKLRTKGNFSFPTIQASLFTQAGEAIDGSMSQDEALQEENLIRVCEESYVIVRNPPTVNRFHFPNLIICGLPITYEIETSFCNVSDCLFQWYVRRPSRERPPVTAKDWVLVHEGVDVTFNSDCIGHWVMVRVVPRSGGGSVCGPEIFEVSADPIADFRMDESPIRTRHRFTEKPLTGGSSFRVVSYNILANFYVDSDFSRNYLFSYCPPKFLKKQYRRPVTMWELVNYNADLVCLQEIDISFYTNVLRPALCERGEFEAQYLTKHGFGPEGVVILYRRSKFELVEDCSLQSLSNALFAMGEDFPEVCEDVKEKANFHEKWMGRNQCLLALVLRCVDDPKKQLLVATTHLHSKPSAHHIRLLQMAVCLKHLEKVKRRFEAAESEGVKCGVVFCGDFNSEPPHGVYRLATKGHLPATAACWHSGGVDEFVGCPVLEHGLQLASAYSGEEPIITNFTSMFAGCLDYIFYGSRELASTFSVPLPSDEDLTKGIALPNEHFPSDHIALISDLEFKRDD